MADVEIGSSADAGSSRRIDVWLYGDRAGDTEPLLLAARQAERRLLQAAPHLVPERGTSQRLLDAPVKVVLHPEDPEAVGDVVVDRLRERVRPLEYHADAAPNLDRIDVASVEVDAVVEHLTLDTRDGHEVVHPVQAAEHGRLAATRRADQRRDRVAVDAERDALHRDGACRSATVRSVMSNTVSWGIAEASDWVTRGSSTCCSLDESSRVLQNRGYTACERRVSKW